MIQGGWQRTWIRTVTTLMTAAVMVMIFCFSMENAAESDQRSGNISMIIIRIFHSEYETMDMLQQKELYDRIQFIVRKCAHFTEYMMLGFISRLCAESWFGHRTKRTGMLPLISLGYDVLYACTDEIHQISIDGRIGAWTDVLVDACGVLAGVLLGTILIRCINRRKTACISGGAETGR